MDVEIGGGARGPLLSFRVVDFSNVVSALEREDMLDDPRCANLITRITHARDLFAMLEQEVGAWPTAELLERARRFGVPMAPANNIQDFLSDPQVQANRTIFDVEEEQAGCMRQLRKPVRFRDAALSLRRHPPRLGQHTDELLREAGFADEEIRSLREGGAVG